MKARDRDRDAAVARVHAAWAAGLIIEADRDLRTAQLRGARTVGDIELVLRDLDRRVAPGGAPAPAAAPAPTGVPAPGPAPAVRPGGGPPAAPAGTRAKGADPRRVALVLIGVVVAMTVVLPILFSLLVFAVVLARG